VGRARTLASAQATPNQGGRRVSQERQTTARGASDDLAPPRPGAFCPRTRARPRARCGVPPPHQPSALHHRPTCQSSESRLLLAEGAGRNHSHSGAHAPARGASTFHHTGNGCVHDAADGCRLSPTPAQIIPLCPPSRPFAEPRLVRSRVAARTGALHHPLLDLREGTVIMVSAIAAYPAAGVQLAPAARHSPGIPSSQPVHQAARLLQSAPSGLKTRLGARPLQRTGLLAALPPLSSRMHKLLVLGDQDAAYATGNLQRGGKNTATSDHAWAMTRAVAADAARVGWSRSAFLQVMLDGPYKAGQHARSL